MTFWRPDFKSAVESNVIACIDSDGRTLSYRELFDAVQKKASTVPKNRSVCIIRTQNSVATLINYLACLSFNHCVLLLEKNAPSNALELAIENYQPNVILDDELVISHSNKVHQLADNLSLLLSTSGSTGTAKFVCLSQQALIANTNSICDYLPIHNTDCVITTLPFSYSFGLSVINTHLAKRSCIVFNKSSVMSGEFWQKMNTYKPTSLYGVPFTFETILRVGGLNKLPASVQYLAQAGGNLSSKIKQRIHEYCVNHSKAFYVMYGQTEATARIAYLDPNKIANKLDSIGQAVSGGHLYLKDEDGIAINADNTNGELIYQGVNTMLGYAENVTDLADFTPNQELATGDLAYRDSEGDFFIQGRIKRIIKINGERTNLDEVERILSENIDSIKVIGEDNLITCVIESRLCESGANKTTDTHIPTIDSKSIATLLGFHPRLIRIRFIDSIPLLANGKVDYGSLKQLC